MEIAQQLGELGRKETGLEQYAIAKFAEALEVCLHERGMKRAASSSYVQQHAHALWPCVILMGEPLHRPVTDAGVEWLQRWGYVPIAKRCWKRCFAGSPAHHL